MTRPFVPLDPDHASEPVNPWWTAAPGLRLDERVMDRVAGVLFSAAVGDALGVPYEFAQPLSEEQKPEMIGGGLGPFAPGEYSDDTQMQVCIAQVAATGTDLRTFEDLDKVAANFLGWYRSGPADVGNQTRSVLATASRHKGPASQAMLAISRRHAETHALSAGNGSLMRTGVVALAYLDDPEAKAEAATVISELTHADPDCAAACVLWCSGIRTAVLEGTIDGVCAGLDLIPQDRRATSQRRTAGWWPLSRRPGPRSPAPPSRRTGPRTRSSPRSTPAGAGGRRTVRRRHRHRRRDRRGTARRALGMLSHPARLAAQGPRVAQQHRSRSGPPGCPDGPGQGATTPTAGRPRRAFAPGILRPRLLRRPPRRPRRHPG